MVGTLGTRSKGCLTCRRRKVKCDEKQPHCQRCQRANITCEGYHRDVIWIDEAPKLSQSSSRAQSRNLPTMQAQSARTSRAFSERGSGSDQNQERSQERPMLERGGLSLTRGRDLGLNAFQDKIYVSFLVRRLFDGGPQAEGYTYQTWISSANASDPLSVSHTALQCLAAAFFGRTHGSPPDIMAQGTALYGQALRRLRASIEDPTTCHGNTNISATMALNLYEMVAFDNEFGWIRHAGGIGCLIEMMGPERVQEYPAHGYFLLSRPLIIFQSLINRRRTFLSNPEWTTLPWLHHPETKTPHHRVLDIFSHLPGLIEDRIAIDEAMTLGHDATIPRAALLHKMTGALKDVVLWRWDWEVSHDDDIWSAPALSNNSENKDKAKDKDTNLGRRDKTRGRVAHEIPTDPLSSLAVDDDRKPIFPTLLYYCDIRVAEELILYNTTLIGFLHLWKQFHGGDASIASILSLLTDEGKVRPRKRNPLILPGLSGGIGEERDGWDAAGVGVLDITREICKSIEYHLLGQHENEGSFFLMFPLRICVFALILNRYPDDPAQSARELKWVVRILKMIAESSGFAIAKRLVSVVPMTPVGSGVVHGLHDDRRVERVKSQEERVGAMEAHLGSPKGAAF